MEEIQSKTSKKRRIPGTVLMFAVNKPTKVDTGMGTGGE